MGTESQNNSYYGGHGSAPSPGPSASSGVLYNPYMQYHNQQQSQDNNQIMIANGIRGISSTAPSSTGMGRCNAYNNNWTPISSSSSSDNSSPSSSSGNYPYSQDMNRNTQSNSNNYYLQSFALGQSKTHWDFMHSNGQKQIPYNNNNSFEYTGGMTNESGTPTSSSSATSVSSTSSSLSSSQGNSFNGGQNGGEKRLNIHGGEQMAVAYHPYQPQSHLPNQHYANSLHYRHQQMLQMVAGKSGNSKDICGDDKHKEDGDPWNEAQAAFLGPNLWDKTLPYDADLKYVDLDEFLSENNIPVDVNNLGNGTSMGHRSESISHTNGLLGLPTKREKRSPSPSDCVSPDTMNPPSPADSTFSFTSSGREFDPRSRAISDEDIKPQPMIKKSRKQFVPEELKDDKYWARRRKNNIAAKRSRDARRQKENQIALRARFLEKENMGLQQEVDQLRQENLELRARLSKYQDV